jgi:hypothetical protein
MSKANREKRQQPIDGFPFKLLQTWIKPYAPKGEICKCSQPVAYVFEHYIDSARLQLLIGEGMPETQAVETVWSQALGEQRRGKYHKYLSSYLCHDCTFAALDAAVGKNAATMALLPGMIVGERSTVLLGVTLQSAQDDGKMFAACAVASSIDVVARQLRSEVLAINMK